MRRVSHRAGATSGPMPVLSQAAKPVRARAARPGVLRALVPALLMFAIPLTLLAQSVQFKNGRISIGDPVERLTTVAGNPDQMRPFPGSPTSTLYEYAFDGRQVNISVKDGEVAGIADNRIVSKPGPAVPGGVQLNGSTIVTGDSLDRLLQSAGKPDRVRSFAGAPGMAVYEYSAKDRQVTVTVRNGKVTGTSEIRVLKK